MSGTTGNLRLPGKVASALKLSGFVDISAVSTLLIKLTCIITCSYLVCWQSLVFFWKQLSFLLRWFQTFIVPYLPVYICYSGNHLEVDSCSTFPLPNTEKGNLSRPMVQLRKINFCNLRNTCISVVQMN